MLGKRLRRWPNIKPSAGRRVVAPSTGFSRRCHADWATAKHRDGILSTAIAKSQIGYFTRIAAASTLFWSKDWSKVVKMSIRCLFGVILVLAVSLQLDFLSCFPMKKTNRIIFHRCVVKTGCGPGTARTTLCCRHGLPPYSHRASQRNSIRVDENPANTRRQPNAG